VAHPRPHLLTVGLAAGFAVSWVFAESSERVPDEN
jgi:hypothetical protein